MLRSLKIENFRCFSSFELTKLGRINLLVGKNNSGKTTVLEAIQLLYYKNNFDIFCNSTNSRREYRYFLEEKEDKRSEFDFRHLFYGREPDIGSEFSIFSTNKDTFNDESLLLNKYHNNQLSVSLGFSESPQLSLFEEKEIMLIIRSGENEKNEKRIPFFGVNKDYFRGIKTTRFLREKIDNLPLTRFVRVSSLSINEMVVLFDQIVLTPNEQLVIQALQTIEPDIERIASVKSGLPSRNGFLIKLTNREQPLPIGSMGDGIVRMLGLVLAIINTQNGIFLVDEIDIGLHFTTMSDMWKLIWETAKRLNVQVFATTHSSDCWQSLAEIAETEKSSEDSIAIHRIEKGNPSGIVIGEDEMAIAAERGIEVR